MKCKHDRFERILNYIYDSSLGSELTAVLLEIVEELDGLQTENHDMQQHIDFLDLRLSRHEED